MRLPIRLPRTTGGGRDRPSLRCVRSVRGRGAPRGITVPFRKRQHAFASTVDAYMVAGAKHVCEDSTVRKLCTAAQHISPLGRVGWGLSLRARPTLHTQHICTLLRGLQYLHKPTTTTLPSLPH